MELGGKTLRRRTKMTVGHEKSNGKVAKVGKFVYFCKLNVCAYAHITLAYTLAPVCMMHGNVSLQK